MALQVKLLNERAIIPTRGSENSAGYDLYSCENITISSKGKGLCGTGIAINMNTMDDVYGRIAPRSGWASKYHIDIGAGVIDKDYRGEVKVLLFNHSEKDLDVKVGDRIAQMIVERCLFLPIEGVCDLNNTERGEGGFGSTGM